MKKALAPITVVLLLTAFGCSNWNKYTPKALDSTAIAEEIRKNMLGDGITGMKVDVDNAGHVTLQGDVKTASDRQKAIDDAQKDVTGTARVKLYKGSCTLAGRKSKNSLYRLDIATFEEDEVYNQKDAEGFIRLNALRLKIRAQRKKASS